MSVIKGLSLRIRTPWLDRNLLAALYKLHQSTAQGEERILWGTHGGLR